MRKICSLSVLLVFASAVALAETWTGPLLDASCVDQHQADQKYDACVPTMGTTSFAIQAAGKILKLDAESNQSAVEQWREYSNSADRAKDPKAAGNTLAVVKGTLRDDEISVEWIKFQ